MTSIRWADQIASEAGAGDDAVALLPLAAIEQHGPHLPLSTDLDIGTGIVESALPIVDAGVDLRVLPTQAVGTSVEHESFAGTLSLPPALLEDTIVALGASVARAGIRRLVLFNAHGGNKGTIDAAALRLREGFGMLVVKASWFRFPRPEDLPIAGANWPEVEWRHGLHGGAVETAMMMYLHPDRVRTEQVADFISLGEELEGELQHLGPEGTASFAWLAEDLHSEGVTGRASLATADAGRVLVDHYGRILAEIVEDAARFPLGRLAGLADPDPDGE